MKVKMLVGRVELVEEEASFDVAVVDHARFVHPVARPHQAVAAVRHVRVCIGRKRSTIDEKPAQAHI